ncbi:MAG: AAA family ATPase [Acidobacteriota bacterium]
MPPPPDVRAAIGPYRILAALGEGGMGVVYRAQHCESGDVVALKTVRVPHAWHVEGIRREIHALFRIRHPGVVRVLDEGIVGGVPWYAMELLAGTTLRRHMAEVRRGRATSAATMRSADVTLEDARSSTRRESTAPAPPPALGAATALVSSGAPGVAGDRRAAGIVPAELTRLLTYLRRVCAPLAYLHGEGLVHRDLKPENVLVRVEGTPVLMDFGLVSSFGGDLWRESIQTEADASGTLCYMSPEQARGELLDARSDLYSLGCILYEAITGRPPFLGDSGDEIVAKHLGAPAIPPSHLVEGVPAALDDLVLSLLAKEPKNRIGHAGVVADALGALGAADAPEGPRARAYLYRPGFRGRDPELAALAPLLPAIASGHGRIALVGGESGVGKTRLLMALAAQARRQRVAVIAGECLPGAAFHGRSEGLQGLRALLDAVVDRCRERGAAESAKLLGDRGKVLAPYHPSLAALPEVAAQPEPPEIPPDAARRRIYATLTDLVIAFSAVRPLCLLIDDLQWADSLTMGFLRYAASAQALSVAPCLVLGAYRLEERTADLELLAAAPGVSSVVLGRLDPGSIGELAAEMLALSPVPGDLALFLAAASEGNPFFAAEYLRTAVDEGLLSRDRAGAWTVTGSRGFASLGLPRSLQDLVTRRLSGLSPAARSLVAAAAAIGRELSLALLARVADRSDVEIRAALSDLLSRQCIEELPEGRLRFVHDKIHEIAYAGIPGKERRELHERIAFSLDAGDEEAPPEVRGHHWERAGDGVRARVHYLAAAREATLRYAHPEAERHYRACLDASGTPGPDRVWAQIELAAEVLLASGRLPGVEQMLADALAEARALGDVTLEARSLQELAFVAYRTGRIDEATHLRGDLQDALGRIDPGHAYARASALQAIAVLHKGEDEVERALELFGQSAAILKEIGDRRLLGVVMANMGAALMDRHRPLEARRAFEEALAIAAKTGSRRLAAGARGNLGLLLKNEGRFAAARVQYEEALAGQIEVGDRFGQGVVLANLGEVSRAGRSRGRAWSLRRGDRDRPGDGQQALGSDRHAGPRPGAARGGRA